MFTKPSWFSLDDAQLTRGGNPPAWPALLTLSVSALALHLLFYKGYGFFRDEMYFIACSHRLAWGYPDHPPGAPFVAWLSERVFGSSVFAIRAIPSLFSAIQVLFAGLTAAAMGGGRYAQVLTCICVLAAPQYFVSYLNTDIFVKVGWAVCAYIGVRVLAGGSPRLWMLFGFFAGLALYGKDSMMFFLFSFTLGILLSSQRRLLVDKRFWFGLAVAIVMLLPNLIWEKLHSWPTLELLRNIDHSTKNIVLSPWGYFASNSRFLSLASFPIWFAGILWCLFAIRAKSFRAFGWMWIIAFATFVFLKGKSYYLAPIYPVLFAAGSVAVASMLERLGQRANWSKHAIAGVILTGAMLRWPFAVAMLPTKEYIEYSSFMGAQPARFENVALDKLPQMYADQFGWPEMTAKVGQIYNSLSPSDKAKCGIYAHNYGEAAALEYYGPKYGLPRVISPHNSFWLWGPGPYTGECLIEVGNSRKNLDLLFGSVVQMGETYHEYAISYENHQPIWIVREPRFGTLQDLWPKIKVYK